MRVCVRACVCSLQPILGVDDDRSAPLQWFARGADGRVRLGAAARRLLQRAVTRLRKASRGGGGGGGGVAL
eukprot:1448475-Pleurochrysis_carterae.AAC.1